MFSVLAYVFPCSHFEFGKMRQRAEQMAKERAERAAEMQQEALQTPPWFVPDVGSGDSMQTSVVHTTLCKESLHCNS